MEYIIQSQVGFEVSSPRNAHSAKRCAMRIPTILLTAVAVACSTSTEPLSVRELGAITGFNAADPHIAA